MLDINMIYNTIQISTQSSNMPTIVTIFWKYRYNHLPMGMWNSGCIFQAKVDNILGEIDSVKTYIDIIMVINKDVLY